MQGNACAALGLALREQNKLSFSRARPHLGGARMASRPTVAGSHQGEGQRMASTFFEYERDHNIFLNALRQNSDLLAIVQYILDKEVIDLLLAH